MMLSRNFRNVPNYLSEFSPIFKAGWHRIASLYVLLLLPAIFALPQTFISFLSELGDQFPKEDTGSLIGFIIANITGSTTFVFIGGTILLFALFIISYIFHIYSLLVIYDEHTCFSETICTAFRHLFSYMMLMIWISVRPFFGLPIITFFVIFFIKIAIGFLNINTSFLDVFFSFLMLLIIVIYMLNYYPRLQFAQIIHLKEKLGVKASTNECLIRTKGVWWKICRNQLIFTLIQIPISLLLIFLVSSRFITIGITLLSATTFVLKICALALLIGTGVFTFLLIIYLSYWFFCFQYELSKAICICPKK